MERDNYVSSWEAGKLENIILETKGMGIDIMGLAEVRWLQSGKIVCNDHALIYSGHKKRSQTRCKFATQQEKNYKHSKHGSTEEC